MLAWKLAPALACGNCAVLKPAETTSITALKFAGILRDAELPPGVVNFVCGAGEVGAEVVRHPLAAKAAFTGWTEVGKAILCETAGSGKRLTLELGGKAANIVFDDAPLDQAVEGVVNGIYDPPARHQMPAVSDLPAGVVNLLTGQRADLLPTFAAHQALRAVGAAGVSEAEHRRPPLPGWLRAA